MSENQLFPGGTAPARQTLRAGAPGTSSQARILVVDDEAGILNLVRTTLARAGFVVRTASDFEEAVRLCGAESFDLVLSDVRMHGGDGHDLVRWLAEHHPGVRSALMTGLDIECPGCPLAGRCKTLHKPFGVGDLMAFVNSLLPL